MSFQKEIRKQLTTGIVGDIVVAGPVRAQSFVLDSGDANKNVIGRAVTHIVGENTAIEAGGTGAFAGILANSKMYARLGTLTGGALGNTMTLPNGINAEAVTFTSGIIVNLLNSANIGDQIEFSQANGTLQSNNTGTATSGFTLIPQSRVVLFNMDAPGNAIIELTV